MRLLDRQSILPAFLLVCVSLVTISPPPGAAYTSRTSGSSSLFYKADEGAPPLDKPRTSSTSSSQSGTTTTTIKKKSKTGSTTEKGMMEKTALVTGSVLCSALYTPAKAIYAAGGTLTGSMVYLMSAGQSTTAAGNIISRSAGGDWFVRPSHLTGERDLCFDAVQVDTKKQRSSKTTKTRI